MKEKRGTGLFENGLIWFGAALSIAEIITGVAFAPLGLAKGAAAILLGHLIGCILLFLAGLIGGRERKSAMETVKMSFGRKGGLLFALLNVIQLLGWTAIMIYDGAAAAQGILPMNHGFWCIVIAALIALWILVGIKNLGRLNSIAMAALFILTVILSLRIFKGNTALPAGELMSFGAAVELSIAMPLSWLPLISDYTREAEKPVRATAVSAVVYGIVSCWMYFIGMGAALFTGESDIAQIILKAGLGVAGLLIVVLSTVTTTFLDAYSAGISTQAIAGKISGKWAALAVTVLGAVGAVALPLYDISGFLYFIGSVFAPMISVQICDFFILRKKESPADFEISRLIIWLAGFVVYRLFMRMDLILGSTVPAMLVTGIMCLVWETLHRSFKKQ